MMNGMVGYAMVENSVELRKDGLKELEMSYVECFERSCFDEI